jgi:hypothetical protein
METLKINSVGESVKTLQALLQRLGFDPGPTDGSFGPKTEKAVMAFQGAHGLTEDGIVGALTWSALNASPSPGLADSATPWMDWMARHEGMNEAHDDKALSVFWKYTNCPDYKTVVGVDHAWCAMTVNAALIESGYLATYDAAAASFATYGTACEPKFGAIIVVRHVSGAHHVAFFHSWLDEFDRLAVLFGGNQSNALQKSAFNLSGNSRGHDEIMACRWPIAAAVLAASPSTPADQSPITSVKMKPLSWEKNHPERKAWSEFLFTQIDAQWDQFDKAIDLTIFRPDYNSLTKDQKINIIAEFICWICEFVSDWDPKDNEQDVGTAENKDTWSVGLMQLSVIDQANYGFKLGYNFEDLQDPIRNLRLGLLILGHQIDKYHLVDIPTGHVGLYWATVHTGGKYDESSKIAAHVKAFAL